MAMMMIVIDDDTVVCGDGETDATHTSAGSFCCPRLRLLYWQILASPGVDEAWRGLATKIGCVDASDAPPI